MIAFRILSRLEVEIDIDWVRNRLQEAQALRKKFLGGRRVYRLIHSEGDSMSGVTVDRYDRVYVVGSSTSGGDRLLPLVTEVLTTDFEAEAVLEKSDSPLRSLEELPELKRSLAGSCPKPLFAKDDDLTWEVDILEGHKTGRYLEHESNRRLAKKFCKGKSVLDVFCYTGGWAIHAATAGAKSVLGIDTSREGIATAQRNAKQNDVDDICTFRIGDAFKVLPSMIQKKHQYDVVILDPPPLAESQYDIPDALEKYEKLNRSALRLIRPPGLLVTCSCTDHLFEQSFLEILRKACRGVQKTIRVVDVRGAGPDHPMHPSCLETEYLTCIMLHVT